MKKSLTRILIALAVVGAALIDWAAVNRRRGVVLAAVPAANAGQRCTTDSLNGSYGFTASGYFPNGAGNAPIVATGVTTLDGRVM